MALILSMDVAKTHDNLCWLYERFILCFGATVVTLYSADLLKLHRIGLFLFSIRMLLMGLDSHPDSVKQVTITGYVPSSTYYVLPLNGGKLVNSSADHDENYGHRIFKSCPVFV